MLIDINNSSFSLTVENQQLIQEYFQLALLETLSESEAQRILEIIEMAQHDEFLSFWLNEADHLIGHQLNLIDENECKNQQAILQEYLDAKYLEIKQLT
ncbi:hypothetical protein [Calothrix sp. UHCC 0171]|uniref:hypothetical protein n=1 Tax=Calothrix sp. UHCC 0171 TaxID=3110245 RepID=UPI002B1EE9E5|nr:hypothetical protein [Calothrix sp. UHCC 0171]MEA5573040.1 hypothetical protein [Calothrix sp. UHCC 0171]